MKPNLLFTRITLLASILAIGSIGAAQAQDNSSNTASPPPSGGDGGNGGNGGGWRHHFDKVLTPDERAQLKKDTDAVFTADPDLKKEGDDLHTQMKSARDGSDTDRKALREKMQAYRAKVRDAVEKLDPSSAAIYAKLEAAFKAHRQGSDSGQ